MRTTFWLLLLFTAFALASCEKDDDSFNKGKNNPKFGEAEVTGLTTLDIGDCEPTVVDLIAGQHTKVGTVKVENDDDFLTVTYKIDGTAWCITETHLHIGMTAEDFPFAGRSSNPAVGRFDYSGDHSCETEVVYIIPKADLPDLQDGYYYIAAHAVVSGQGSEGKADLKGFASKLPAEVGLNIKTFPGNATVAYFEDIHISGGSFLDGTDYDGWCVESTLGIKSNFNYTAKVYSSYDKNLPSGIVDQPANLGKLNWLLNQDFVGKDAGGGLGYYTFKDLQVAIWKLIAFYPTNISPDGVDGFDKDRVDKLLELAGKQGKFVPGCGDLIVLILKIRDAQNIVITVPLPCKDGKGGEETAWGAGTRFTERGNWAMYFKHKWMICD